MRKVTTKNIAICALLTALMFTIAVITNLISLNIGKSIFQISDFIYLALIAYLNPYTIIFSAILSGILTDLISGVLIYIPMTILVKFLIGLSFIILKRIIPSCMNIFISYLWIFSYVFYSYLLFDSSVAIIELITDSCQYFINTILAVLIYFILKRTNLKDNLEKENI